MKLNFMIKVILEVVIILTASVYLPEIFWNTFKFQSNRPRIAYSPIINDFLISESDEITMRVKGNGFKYVDRKGNRYTRDDYEAIMPQINFAQLVFSGKMPDSINGLAVDVPLLRKNLIMSSFEPFLIDGFSWKWYPLMESSPGRVNLEFPNEFFNIKKRMEIIDSRTNKTVEKMSQAFTDELIKNGFAFPVKELFGNPTTRKAFDEGYFIIDNKDQFYHLKRVKNKPYCKKIELPAGMKILHFNIHEIPLKEFYGFFVTENSGLYLLTFNDYRIIKLDIEDYDLNNSVLRINGDLFNRNVSVVNDNQFSNFIFNRDYKLIDKYKGQLLTQKESPQGKIAAYLFPFSLKLLSDKSMFVNFYFSFSNLRFVIINVLLTLCIIFFFWIKKLPLGKNSFPLILILLFGIYGLIAVLVIRDFNQSNSFGVNG